MTSVDPVAAPRSQSMMAKDGATPRTTLNIPMPAGAKPLPPAPVTPAPTAPVSATSSGNRK